MLCPKEWINEYEKWLSNKDKLSFAELDNLLNFILYLQHERFIHLIITFMTGIVFFIMTYIMLIVNFIITDILFLAVTIVLACYIAYYCFLENKTQFFESKYLEYSRKGFINETK